MGVATQGMYKSNYAEGTDFFDKICSYLEVEGKLYDLMLYSDFDSPYDAYLVEATNIKAPYTVYAFDIQIGSNFAERQYFFIEGGVPYLLAQIACASEVDVNNDGFDETIFSNGLPMYTKRQVITTPTPQRQNRLF